MKIITTHKNTDFDGLASVFAASLLHPEAQPVLPRSLNPNVQAFLSIHKDHFSFKHPKDIALDDTGELVVVDANSWSRLDDLSSLAEQAPLIIHIWDHHMEPDLYLSRVPLCRTFRTAAGRKARDRLGDGDRSA